MSEEDNVLPAPKKRGRPKGSLGKEKLAQEKAHVLDVSFDSEEILPREDKPVEMEPPTPRVKRRPRKPRNLDPPTDVEEDQFQEPVQPVQPVQPERPASYMEVLQRGIALAKATEKQRKIDLYDSYFRIR